MLRHVGSIAVSMVLGVLGLCSELGAHNTTTPQLLFPNGAPANVDGYIDPGGEYSDAQYTSFVYGTRTYEINSKFDPATNYCYFAFVVPDDTDNGANDQVVIHFDNYDDGAATNDWSMGKDRTDSNLEWKDLTPNTQPNQWNGTFNDYINYCQIEIRVKLQSSKYKYQPGVSMLAAGILFEFKNNGTSFFWPPNATAASDYANYTNMKNEMYWVMPTPTSTISATHTATPSASPSPSATPTLTHSATITETPLVFLSPTATPSITTTSTVTTSSIASPELPTLTCTPTPSPQPDTPTPTVTLTSTPGTVILTIQKAADKIQATTGDSIRYSLRIRNLGTGIATNALIQDTLPAYTQYHNGTGTLNAGIVSWQGNLLPASTLDVWFEVSVGSAPVGTIINNSATVESAESSAVTSNTVQVLWVTPPPATATPQIIGKNEAAIYPHPAAGKTATFLFFSADDGEATICIYNTGGRLAGEFKHQAEAGVVNRAAWNISGLPAGIYVFEVRMGSRVIAKSKFSRVP